MASLINLDQLAHASVDADTLGQVINGNDQLDVLSRLGAKYPTIAKALRLIVQNGLLGAMPFSTYTDLTASALSDNSYAVVTNDDDPAKNGVWQKKSGTWIYSKYNVLSQLSSQLETLISQQIATAPTAKTNTGTDIVFAFNDEQDYSIANIDSLGNINAGNITSDINSGFAYAVVDDAGNVAFAIDKNGQILSPTTDALTRQVNSITANLQPKNSPFDNQKTDYMHIFSYGQSLSRGDNAQPPVSTTQPYKNWTFKSGVLPRYTETHDWTALKPLVEEVFFREGESPTSSICNNFVRLQVAKGDVADDWQFIGTAPGEGGQPIQTFVKNTTRYSGLVEQIKSAYTIAQSQNKSYSVWAMCWTQGENNYAIDTQKDEYKALLARLHDDFCDDVMRLTHQTFRPPLIIYQTVSHRTYWHDYNQIAIAQYELAHERDDVVMACSIYHLPHFTDNLHLIPDSSVQLGRYYAKALDYSLTHKDKWQPLQPKAIIGQGKVIDITFNKSGLTLDTSLVSQTNNYGFDIYADNALNDIIASVVILGSNRVKLLLNTDLPKNAVLTYARGRPSDPHAGGNIQGPRGNLRDNAGDNDNYQDSTGTTRYMHNWCVMFERAIN